MIPFSKIQYQGNEINKIKKVFSYGKLEGGGIFYKNVNLMVL